MMLLSVLVSLSLAAPPTDAKALAKEAMEQGPDVSKMPFTMDSVKQIVLAYQPKIQGCYEDHIANMKKPPEGSIKTAFTITADGFVKGAKVNRKTSTLRDSGLHDCVVAVLSSMAFPKPPDAKDHPIEFPFNLKAQP